MLHEYISSYILCSYVCTYLQWVNIRKLFVAICYQVTVNWFYFLFQYRKLNTLVTLISVSTFIVYSCNYWVLYWWSIADISFPYMESSCVMHIRVRSILTSVNNTFPWLSAIKKVSCFDVAMKLVYMDLCVSVFVYVVVGVYLCMHSYVCFYVCLYIVYVYVCLCACHTTDKCTESWRFQLLESFAFLPMET